MMTNNVQLEKYKEVINNLYRFYQYFVIDHFTKKIIPAPHIEKLSKELMKMYRGDYQKLTVSMPPRHSKSSLITLAFPLWLIVRDPTLNIMVINSTFTLSESFGIRIRDLFEHYGEKLGLRVSDKKHASGWLMFEDLDGNLTGGSIRLIGIGGQITGFDADWIIVDDLVKGIQDTTKTVLDKTKDFFNGIIMQRVEPHTRLIVLGTIWHSDDILSYLRTEHEDEYKIIDMPAYDTEGNTLWPNRYDMEFFNTREKEMGTQLFQALYLSNPLDETGDFFNLDSVIFQDDFQFDNPLITGKCRSWDFAYKAEEPGKDHDYTASCKMYRLLDDTYYVTDVTMARYGDDLLKTVKAYARMDTANVPILMETGTKGGAAHELYNQYKTHFTGYRVHESEAVGSKVDRATAFKYALLQGKIRFVLDDNKREILLRQLKGFPLAKHEDLVDALAYAYNFLSEHGESVVRTGNKMKRETL